LIIYTGQLKKVEWKVAPITDLVVFLNEVLKQCKVIESDMETKQRVIQFLEDNNWFESRPKNSAGKVQVTNTQMKLYAGPLKQFLQSGDEHDDRKILELLAKKFPETTQQFFQFCEQISATEETKFYVTDFLLFNLKKDLFLMNDIEIAQLVRIATADLIKAHGDTLTFFLSWLRANHKVAYRNEYIMKNRYSMESKNGAYDFDEYLELLYYLFNDDYIQENEMYAAAAKSKNYADTWLFLALHFICSLRTTDLKRISHPILTKSPVEVLREVTENEFSDADARETLLSITTRLCVLPLTPNKTAAHQNIAQIKFMVPESCEVHIGTLLAVCEAHAQLEGPSESEPLVRRITDYDRISRYMGDEIGSLFLESNFRSRSANKSYLQSVYMLSDDILETENEGPKVKGYILAALARGHKGSYGHFAETTAIYLKDAKMSGLTPEFVAKELFERGVLSFIPAMLLKIVTQGSYNDLSVSRQTKLIKELNLSPGEVEKVVALTVKGRQQAQKTVSDLMNTGVDEADVLNILHRIGSGQAFSKQAESLCLLSACNKLCPYDDRTQCVGCPFEIRTKSTMLLLTSEHQRLRRLFDNASTPIEKAKYRQLLIETVIPCLDEVLSCLRNEYGDDVFTAYEQIIKEHMA